MMGLSYFIPELISIGLLVYFIVEALIDGNKDRPSLFIELAVGTAILGMTLFFCAKKMGLGFNGFISADPLAYFFKIFFTFVFGVITFMCRDFFRDDLSSGASPQPAKPLGKQQEFALILWCALIGLYFLASANHVLVLFISLEILTMALYVLTTHGRHALETNSRRSASIEAGLKYLTLGSLASGFMIFGIALLYLKTGALSFPEIAAAKQILLYSRLGNLALLFIFAGLGFKIASFPFQLWIPDVYQGSPSPATALLSVASKSAGFLILIRFFGITVGPLDAHWKTAFAALALFTMFYGNLGALAQTSLKRLLGYSSIGHAGFLLLAMASGTAFSLAAILYYLLGYAVSSLAVFYVIVFIEKATGSDSSKNLDGLSQTSPFLSSVLFVALLSLAGVPPLAGFMGKFWILFSTLRFGLGWPVLVACTMVVVGIYYYLSLALKMFFREPSHKVEFLIPLSSKVVLIILTLLSLGIGIFQAPLFRIAFTAITKS